MFSLLRRPSTHPAPAASTSSGVPAIHEPPPPAKARREKESRWLASIASSSPKKGSSRDHGSGAADRPAGYSAKGKERAREEDVEREREAVYAQGPGNGRAGSTRSRRSFLPSSLRSGRERAPPSSSSSSAAPPSSLHPLSPPAQAPGPAPPPPDSTLNLAQRLQELAVAHADGLLDEEEYRVLRGAAFESTVAPAERAGGRGAAEVVSEGGLAVPRLNGGEVRAHHSSPALSSQPHSPPPLSQSHRSPTLQPAASSPSLRPASVLSSQSRRGSVLSLGGLFRKPTSPSLRNEPLSPTQGGDTSSVFSGRSSHTSRVRNRTEPGTSSPPLGQGLMGPPTSYGTVRTRSIRNHPGLASSALDLRSSRSMGIGGESVLSSSSAGSAARSSYSYRAPPGPGLSPTKRGQGKGMSSAYSHASSLASSTRYETLSSASHSHHGHSLSPSTSHSTLPPIPSSSDPLILAATSRDPTAIEIRREIEEIEAEWRRVRQGWSEAEGVKVRAWEGEVGEEIVEVLGGRVQAPLEEPAGLANAPADDTARKKGLFRRASFSPSLPPPLPSHSQPAALLPSFLHPTPTLPAAATTLPDDLLASTHRLVEEVRALREKRRETDEKYERRVGFLRSRLRGAEIREGLRRR
ncbi:hypothetical protein JCM10213_005936 [Rhodosporidiobolus nylandii]